TSTCLARASAHTWTAFRASARRWPRSFWVRACAMDFIDPDGAERVSVRLEPRVLVMRGPARYSWRHAIAARKSDPTPSGRPALLSWFVTHPPEGVWAVSCLRDTLPLDLAEAPVDVEVTAASDAIIDQLLAITGVPQCDLSTDRARHLPYLLAIAAWCAKETHR